jgi:hypothetical protein
MYTSLDDITAELAAGKGYRADFFKLNPTAYVAGNAYCLAGATGNPVNTNAFSGTALNAVVPDDTVAWALWHGGNVTPDTKQVLNAQASFTGTTAAPGIAMLVDIAMYYPGVNLLLTTLQTMVNGVSLTRWTDGRGLRPFIVMTALTGNGASTPVQSVFNYRDQDDNDAAYSGMTINYTTGGTAIPPVGKIVHAGPQANLPGPFLPLNAGDTGIKRVNSFQLSTAYTTATVATAAICLARPLLSIPLVAPGVPGERSFIYHAPARTIIPDGACLAWLYQANAATAANSAFQGHLDLGWS